MMQHAVVLLAATLLAAGPAAAATSASASATPLVLEAEHQNVTDTFAQGGAAVSRAA